MSDKPTYVINLTEEVTPAQIMFNDIGLQVFDCPFYKELDFKHILDSEIRRLKEWCLRVAMEGEREVEYNILISANFPISTVKTLIDSGITPYLPKIEKEWLPIYGTDKMYQDLKLVSVSRVSADY